MKDKELENAITRFLNNSTPRQMLPEPPRFSTNSFSTTPDIDVDKLNDVLTNMQRRIISLEKDNRRLQDVVNQLRGAGSGGWRRAWGWLVEKVTGVNWSSK